jgi:hypothetical protein
LVKLFGIIFQSGMEIRRDDAEFPFKAYFGDKDGISK